MIKIKLVAFDWNGTILDDMIGGVKAESATRVHFGFNPTTLVEVQNHFAIPIRQYWENSGMPTGFFDEHSAEIDEVFMRHYEPEESKAEVRKNTLEILEWLKSEGINSIIFSNHIIPHIVKQTQRLGIYNYFDEILARPVLGDLTHHNTTFKDQLLKKYVESNSFRPDEVVVIGDTIEEIEIGKKFGYYPVALADGWQSAERLQSAKPAYLIRDLMELKNIIQKINAGITQRN
jgi:phosphoglycolate phosphatase-like HAD superfamily hydrolase